MNFQCIKLLKTFTRKNCYVITSDMMFVRVLFEQEKYSTRNQPLEYLPMNLVTELSEEPNELWIPLVKNGMEEWFKSYIREGLHRPFHLDSSFDIQQALNLCELKSRLGDVHRTTVDRWGVIPLNCL